MPYKLKLLLCYKWAVMLSNFPEKQHRETILKIEGYIFGQLNYMTFV